MGSVGMAKLWRLMTREKEPVWRLANLRAEDRSKEGGVLAGTDEVLLAIHG